MAPLPTGTLLVRTLVDDSRAFYLRFRVGSRRERVILHERSGCACGCGGGWDEPAARTELGNILARIRVGVWTPPERPSALATASEESAIPTFHVYASWWLQAKIDGALGDKRIAANTIGDYRWRLANHLLPFFGRDRLDAIDADLCLAFKAHKLREASELRAALDAGADIRDSRGRRAVPLAPASIRKLIDTLAAILDDAIEDGHIEHNPARRKRMRVRVPKPKRTFLEMDELAALLSAATAQDAPLADAPPLAQLGPTTRLVAHLLAQGNRPAQIAKQLGVARSTVSWHLRRLNANVGRGYVGRRVVCEILGRSGPRVSELCDMRIGHVRLHDKDGARFRIPDAKTETGVREVQMTPDLVEAVIDHIDRLRRAGLPTGPGDYLVPNLNGGRISRQRVGEIVKEAAEAASEQLVVKGAPPLPNTTPHTLRRTYISIALLANNFDVKWVMGQVGHADSKMTLDVYAQLEQRVDRSHGTSFDRLIAQARDQLDGLIGSPSGHNAEIEAADARGEAGERGGDVAHLQADQRMARPGLEPGTPRFSVVCSTN